MPSTDPKGDLLAWVSRLSKLAAWGTRRPNVRRALTTNLSLHVNRQRIDEGPITNYSGRAWWWLDRVHLTLTPYDPAINLMITIHEAAHIATPVQSGHGPVWVDVYRLAVRELTGDLPIVSKTGRKSKYDWDLAALECIRPFFSRLMPESISVAASQDGC